jgi:polysaccharide deacetylase family protein (PEP-CTERM system associated)
LVLNALTIDVEEYFHAENLRPAYPPERWDELESRVAEPLERLLERLRARGLRATFFVLGWLAERRPGIVRAIARAGHEVASHGYGHELLTKLDPEGLRRDVARASRVITAVTGRAPRGYRAPCFTIGPKTRWALPVLAASGIEYDSSVFPVRHDLYGDPDAPTVPHAIEMPEGTLTEAPPATLRALGRNWPVAGGGWMRLLPWRVCAAGISRLNAQGAPAVLYLHPWELDAGQPHHPGISWRKRLRHSIGTARMLEKLERLMDRFELGALETVLEERGLLPCRQSERKAVA